MSESAQRLRVLITVLGLDQHEAGALVVSRILRDAGIEVIYIGRLNVPDAVVETAIQEDVDVVGVSCHSWEFLYYAEELARRLHDLDPPIPIVVGGSVITPSDRLDVLAKGIDEAVLPGASEEEVIEAFHRLSRRDSVSQQA